MQQKIYSSYKQHLVRKITIHNFGVPSINAIENNCAAKSFIQLKRKALFTAILFRVI